MFRSRIFTRIFVPSILAIILLFSAMYLLSIPYIQKAVEHNEENSARTILNNVYSMVEQTHLELENYRQSIILERKEQLRNILLVVHIRVNKLLDEVKAGRISKEKARQELLKELRQIKYGHNDYIWASDYHSVLISHPDPKLNGADYSKVKDLRDNLIVPPMVEMARQGAGDGYYSYWWRRLGEERPVEKITYFKHIPEFEIVIGTGVYLDDIETMVENKKNLSVDNLRERLRHTVVAKTGYIFIFDGQYVMHIHPNANIEYTNVSLLLDQASKKPLFPQLVQLADKEQSLRYLWDKPSDPGNYSHEKMAWVRYFKEFDWYIGSSAYLDELGATARTLRNRMLAIFMATLLFTVVLIYHFVARLTSPLLRMRTMAQHVIDGDLDARCALKQDDEIGIVAMALDNMVERLQENIRNLDHKVLERTAALEQACLELKEMDRIKSGFLSSVSHELRTPMTSVIGFVKQVKKKLEGIVFPKTVEDEKTGRAMRQIRESLDIVIHESEHLTNLINNVLYCATLEAGKVNWSFSPIDTASLLKRILSNYTPLAAQKGLQLHDDCRTELPPVTGDEIRLLQVFNSLLNNAITFTDHGHITLHAEHQGDFVLFSINDTGCGIAQENLERIFDTFIQIGDTLTSKPEGAGLGLSICKQVIQYHGGKIWVESAVNRGSTFYFTIPVQKGSSGN